MACTGIARPIVTGVPCGLVKKGSLSGVVDPVQTIGHDQLLLRDSYAPHYTTAEWPGYEHLLADRKYTVGTLRTPRAGRCWLFDGTNDYAARNDSNLKPTGDFTITLWIKTDWTATDDGIVGAWSTTGYMLYRDSGVLRCYRDNNYAASSLNLNTSGYSNIWIHLAVVANGTSCKFYVNGSQFGTTQTFSTSTQAANGAVPFYIGAYGGPQGHIAASIRDVRLYGVAKSDSEIAAIANQASTPGTYDTTGLLGSWWCEEESGTTGYDWSGNGRHLTLTNITQSTFHAADTDVTYSDANVRGFNLYRKISATTGGSNFDTNRTFLSQVPISGDFDIEFIGPGSPSHPVLGVQTESVRTTSNNYTTIDFGFQATSTTQLVVWTNGTQTSHTIAINYTTSVIRLTRVGTTGSIYVDGVLVTTKTISSSDMYVICTFSSNNETAVTYRGADLQEPNLNVQQNGQATRIVSESRVVPAASSTLDVNGRALMFTGKVEQPGYAPQKVATFDAVNDYATASSRITPTGALTSFTACAWIKSNNSGQNQIMGEWGTANQRIWSFATDWSHGIVLWYSVDGVTYGTVNFGVGMPAATWYHVAVTYNAGTVRFYANGVFFYQYTTMPTSLFNGTSPFRIGGGGMSTIDGSIADARLYSTVKTDAEILAIRRHALDATGLLGHWPMCEGPGSSNTNTTIYDVSGNGKHLTITNATISSFWANASTYDSCIPNHPLKYGYTVNGSGVIVPALLSGASDAAGNAIGQAAGGWASGLQNLNCLPYTNPLGVSVGLETSLDPTADRKTTSSSKRRRRNTSGRYDRFGARATAMSDSTSNTYFGD